MHTPSEQPDDDVHCGIAVLASVIIMDCNIDCCPHIKSWCNVAESDPQYFSNTSTGMLLTIYIYTAICHHLLFSLCVIGCQAWAKEKEQGIRETERGSWVSPCDLASCCFMLAGETEREARGRNRGERGREGSGACRHTMWLVTIPSAERERGAAAGDEHTHTHAQAGMWRVRSPTHTHTSPDSAEQIYSASHAASRLQNTRQSQTQQHLPRPSTHLSVCADQRLRYNSDCVLTDVDCVLGDGGGTRHPERRAANVNNGETKKRRLHRGWANG